MKRLLYQVLKPLSLSLLQLCLPGHPRPLSTGAPLQSLADTLTVLGRAVLARKTLSLSLQGWAGPKSSLGLSLSVHPRPLSTGAPSRCLADSLSLSLPLQGWAGLGWP